MAILTSVSLVSIFLVQSLATAALAEQQSSKQYKSCYKPGEKCQGVPGFPEIPYLGCCGGYTCEGKAPDWGLVCIEKASADKVVDEKSCYEAGERCAGAVGFPAIPWLGCCDGYACAGKAKDWGYVCVKKLKAVSTNDKEKACYKPGERCIGAPGFPLVPWLGCCGNYVCEGKTKDYGFVCIAPNKAPSEVVSTTVPHTNASEICSAKGQRCGGYHNDCCEHLFCAPDMSDVYRCTNV